MAETNELRYGVNQEASTAIPILPTTYLKRSPRPPNYQSP